MCEKSSRAQEKCGEVCATVCMRLHTPSVTEDFTVCKRNLCNKKKHYNNELPLYPARRMPARPRPPKTWQSQSLQSCPLIFKVSRVFAVEFLLTGMDVGTFFPSFFVCTVFCSDGFSIAESLFHWTVLSWTVQGQFRNICESRTFLIRGGVPVVLGLRFSCDCGMIRVVLSCYQWHLSQLQVHESDCETSMWLTGWKTCCAEWKSWGVLKRQFMAVVCRQFPKKNF